MCFHVSLCISAGGYCAWYVEGLISSLRRHCLHARTHVCTCTFPICIQAPVTNNSEETADRLALFCILNKLTLQPPMCALSARSYIVWRGPHCPLRRRLLVALRVRVLFEASFAAFALNTPPLCLCFCACLCLCLVLPLSASLKHTVCAESIERRLHASTRPLI